MPIFQRLCFAICRAWDPPTVVSDLRAVYGAECDPRQKSFETGAAVRASISRPRLSALMRSLNKLAKTSPWPGSPESTPPVYAFESYRNASRGGTTSTVQSRAQPNLRTRRRRCTTQSHKVCMYQRPEVSLLALNAYLSNRIKHILNVILWQYFYNRVFFASRKHAPLRPLKATNIHT